MREPLQKQNTSETAQTLCHNSWPTFKELLRAECKNKDGRAAVEGGLCKSCADEFWRIAAILDVAVLRGGKI
jgi:hypothetical protein